MFWCKKSKIIKVLLPCILMLCVSFNALASETLIAESTFECDEPSTSDFQGYFIVGYAGDNHLRLFRWVVRDYNSSTLSSAIFDIKVEPKTVTFTAGSVPSSLKSMSIYLYEYQYSISTVDGVIKSKSVSWVTRSVFYYNDADDYNNRFILSSDKYIYGSYANGFFTGYTSSLSPVGSGIRWRWRGETDFKTSVTDGVASALEEQERREEDNATAQGNSSVAQGESAIADNSASLKSGVQGFVTAISYNGTDCSLPIPEIYIPAIPNVIGRTKLLDSSQMDFKQWIDAIPCLELVQVLLTLSLCLFGVKEFYSLIYTLLNNRRDNLDE